MRTINSLWCRMLFFCYGIFCFGHVEAACVPIPDVRGLLKIQSCTYHKENGNRNNPRDDGIIFGGMFEKIKFIPGRETNREPGLRKATDTVRKAYLELAPKENRKIFFQTKDKKMCSTIKIGTKIELDTFVYCCESFSAESASLCSKGFYYYTEDIPLDQKNIQQK